MKKVFAVLMILFLSVGCSKAKDKLSLGQAIGTVPAAATEPAGGATTEKQPAATKAPADAPVEYAFTFTANTLDGKTVTEEVLGQYDLTMVNVWASWCPYCLEEFPDLVQLYGRLPQNVGFLSVTVDDAGDLDEARKLLKKYGCDFLCVDGQRSAGLMKAFLADVSGIPCTLFLDRSGNQVGNWIAGAPLGQGSVADAYMKEIQARLALLGK